MLVILSVWSLFGCQFIWFIQRIQFKDVVMVPLVGITFGNVINGVTNYFAYKYEMSQALSTWLVGHFSMVLRGRYEKLATILQNTRIANVENKKIVGTAYPKYMDDSYYIEIGEETERRIRLLSDVFAVLFMFNEKLNNMKYSVLFNFVVTTFRKILTFTETLVIIFQK